ncbi:MAG: Bax inhibitor-1 family protein [Myxococcota bacterium]|nr:Bax inhibitor-1 family protein [Myxococcota bacterium]
MSYVSYQTRMAAQATVNERVEFLKKVYLHLGGAILGWIALMTVLYNSSFGQNLAFSLAKNWIVLMIAFMAAGHFASKWAFQMGNPTKQYLGLGLYVVAQAVIFMPLLMYVKAIAASKGVAVTNMIGSAGIITGVTFGGLTLTALVSKKDFSFLGRALQLLSFAALGMIIVSWVFSGVQLGDFFAMAMVVLMGGYVLYYTSTIMRQFPIGSHVAASLALFSTIATMFYYVLMLVSSRD